MKLAACVILTILSISISVGKCDRTNTGQVFKKTTLQPFSYTFGMQESIFSIYFHIQLGDNVVTNFKWLKAPLLKKKEKNWCKICK